MLPNFNNGHMQHQHQHQQGQQLGPQQGQQQQEGHPSFPDARVWQQMQQLNNQARQGGGDMNGAVPSQLQVEMLRQRQLQQQQMNSGQQFGMGRQPMNNGMGGGPSGSPQQPPLGQSGPGQQHPQHMQGFPNAPLSNTSSIQQPMNRNAIVQAFQASQNGRSNANNPTFTRSLELMMAQQNQQQPQNSPMQMAARIEHQRQLQGLNPNPAGNQPPQNPQGNPQPRKLTPQELNDRIQTLGATLSEMERKYHSLNQPSPPPELQMKLRAMAMDMKLRRDTLQKMMQALQSMNNMGQFPQNGGQNPTHGPAMAWNVGPFESANNGPPARPMSTQVAGPSTTVQPSPSHVHTPLQQPNQVPPNQLPGGPVPPPRNNATPSQQIQSPSNPASSNSNNANQGASGSFGVHMSPSMGQLFPFNMPTPNASGSSPSGGIASGQQSGSGGQLIPNGSFPPPLEKSRFEAAYKTYSAQQGIKPELRLLSVENKVIDLYQLHVNVMQEGGGTKVHNKEVWSVIGGRMGFVNFPGSENEPAKSGPVVAQRLATVYKDYLAKFDSVYINSVIESRRKMQAGVVSTPQAVPASKSLPLNNPGQMAKLIQYANMSTVELRNSNLPEQMINFVEMQRASIQRAGQQGMLQQAIRPQIQDQGSSASAQLGSPFHGVTGLPSVTHPNPMQPGPSQAFGGYPANGMPNMHPGGLPEGRPPNMPPMFNQGPGGPLVRPTPDQLQMASAFVTKIKTELMQHTLPNMRPVEIPPEGRAEYNAMFQQLTQMVEQLDSKMPFLLFILKSEDLMRKIIAVSVTANHQKQLLTSGNPRFVVSPEILRNMLLQLQTALNHLRNYFMATQQQLQQQPQQQHPLHMRGQMSVSNAELNRQPLSMNLQASQQLHQPGFPASHPPLAPPNAPPNAVNRPSVNLRPPPVPKKVSAPTPGTSHSTSVPTPPYSAATPAASAPTPTTNPASPQQNTIPNSPKTRVNAKAKANSNTAKQRRPSSVKGQGSPSINADPPQSSVEKQEASTSNASTLSVGKRPREEESTPAPTSDVASTSASAVANEPSPPKRIKTEWGGPTSEELKRKQETVENIKTEEDASAFMEQVTEFIKMTSGQESTLSSDISETLDALLKGCGSMTDGLDLSGLADSSILSPSTKMTADDFGDFFDFSSFGTQDDESKAPTPELSASSSTNPSPESGSESEAAHQASVLSPERKPEEMPDLLRLGTWKEIDGGESAYYQSGEWKWDGLMSMPDQPWAIS